jgi:hypothetical protein
MLSGFLYYIAKIICGTSLFHFKSYNYYIMVSQRRREGMIKILFIHSQVKLQICPKPFDGVQLLKFYDICGILQLPIEVFLQGVMI